MRTAILFGAAVFGSIMTGGLVALLFADQPQPQVVLPCRIVSVHDGDTLTATVTLTMDVRLLDCWAPELKEPKGPRSKTKLTELAVGKDGVLTIPLGKEVSHSFTFGRVLGRVSVGGKDLSEQMVSGGYATKERQ